MENWPRTIEEARRDVEYAIRLHHLHERLLGRMNRVARFIELFGGSAALIGVAAQAPIVMSVASVLIAGVAYANLAFDFDGSGRAHGQTARELETILATASDSLEELDRRAGHAHCKHRPIEGLRLPAYNDVMLRNGLREHVQPLTRWQRLMQTIA